MVPIRTHTQTLLHSGSPRTIHIQIRLLLLKVCVQMSRNQASLGTLTTKESGTSGHRLNKPGRDLGLGYSDARPSMERGCCATMLTNAKSAGYYMSMGV